MIGKILLTLFAILISKIQYLIYAFMILSTYENAGLITICYPFMIFGWALLEETRPTPRFWKYLKIWTTIVLFIKFFYNIKWEPILSSADNLSTNSELLHSAISMIKNLYTKVKVKADEHNVLLSYLKLGTYSYNKLTDLVWYIIPEVVILSLLMVNSIYLRLIGYKRLSELDIEDVTEGIERVLEKGDL